MSYTTNVRYFEIARFFILYIYFFFYISIGGNFLFRLRSGINLLVSCEDPISDRSNLLTGVVIKVLNDLKNRSRELFYGDSILTSEKFNFPDR